MRYTDMDQGCTVTLEQQFSKCGPTGSICTIWELVRKANSGGHPRRQPGPACILASPPGDSAAGRFENHCFGSHSNDKSPGISDALPHFQMGYRVGLCCVTRWVDLHCYQRKAEVQLSRDVMSNDDCFSCYA